MAVAFVEASRARRWRVFMPRWASQQSKGDGTAPMAFWRKVSRSLSSSELKAAAPINTSFGLLASREMGKGGSWGDIQSVR